MPNPFRSPEFCLPRQDIFKKIEESLEFYPSSNISLVGFHGVGKKKIIQAIEPNLNGLFPKEKLLIVTLNIKEIDFQVDFLFNLNQVIYSRYIDSVANTEINSEIETSYKRIQDLESNQKEGVWGPLVRKTESFIQEFRNLKIKIFCILENFDYAHQAFRHICYYQVLKKLSNIKIFKFITLSYSGISEIEHKVESNSDSFAQEFTSKEIIVGHLKEESVSKVLQEFKKDHLAIHFTKEIENDLIYYSGDNPSLIVSNAEFIYDYCDNLGDKEFSKIRRKMEKNAANYNIKLIKKLKSRNEDTVLKRLCMNNYNKNDITIADALLEHGIVIRGSDGRYHAYSAFFQNFIEQYNPEAQSPIPHIYISASNSDYFFTNQLERQFLGLIRNDSITLQTNLDLGKNIEKQLPEVLEKTELVFVVVSPDYSAYKFEELKVIKQWEESGKIGIIPVLYKSYDITKDGLGLDKFETFPPQKPHLWLSQLEDLDSKLSEIVEKVKKILLEKSRPK